MHLRLSEIVMRLPGLAEPLFRLPLLDISSGTRTLIQGPSGSGKTTLLHLLCGQFLPHAGSVFADDTELTALGAAARARFRRTHFGIVFQRANLIPHLTVFENVLLGVLPRVPDARERAHDALRALGLEAWTAKRAGLLSPGEQQRVAVARVRAASPDVILADEPTSSLDTLGADAVMDALSETANGKTWVVVSHDPRVASRFAVAHDFAELTAAP